MLDNKACTIKHNKYSHMGLFFVWSEGQDCFGSVNSEWRLLLSVCLCFMFSLFVCGLSIFVNVMCSDCLE